MDTLAEDSLTAEQQAIARDWEKIVEREKDCKLEWKRLHRMKKRLARKAGLGRKKVLFVPISETHQLKILNRFQGADEVFGGGFVRKIEIEQVKRHD